MRDQRKGIRPMGSFSLLHWLVVLVVILIVFGAGRLPTVMGDLAKGVKAFREGLRDDGPAGTGTQTAAPQAIPGQPAAPAAAPGAAPAAQPQPAQHNTPSSAA